MSGSIKIIAPIINPNWVQAAELFAEIIEPCGFVYFVHIRRIFRP
ncbi:MAG: hypothetical protein ACFFD2_16730 [Promethearchaeota archaeon]